MIISRPCWLANAYATHPFLQPTVLMRMGREHSPQEYNSESIRRRLEGDGGRNSGSVAGSLLTRNQVRWRVLAIFLSPAIRVSVRTGLLPGHLGLPFFVHFPNPVPYGQFPRFRLVGDVLDETSRVEAHFLGHTDILSREATAVLRFGP